MKKEVVLCELGDDINADIALLGAMLMSYGVYGKDKEEIKDYVYKLIVSHRDKRIQ